RVLCVCVLFFFFFQAEDGIRDFHVTGVQTCALPIWWRERRARASTTCGSMATPRWVTWSCRWAGRRGARGARRPCRPTGPARGKIGRASCRERVEIAVGDVGCERQKEENEGKRRRHK